MNSIPQRQKLPTTTKAYSNHTSNATYSLSYDDHFVEYHDDHGVVVVDRSLSGYIIDHCNTEHCFPFRKEFFRDLYTSWNPVSSILCVIFFYLCVAFWCKVRIIRFKMYVMDIAFVRREWSLGAVGSLCTNFLERASATLFVFPFIGIILKSKHLFFRAN